MKRPSHWRDLPDEPKEGSYAYRLMMAGAAQLDETTRQRIFQRPSQSTIVSQDLIIDDLQRKLEEERDTNAVLRRKIQDKNIELAEAHRRIHKLIDEREHWIPRSPKRSTEPSVPTFRTVRHVISLKYDDVFRDTGDNTGDVSTDSPEEALAIKNVLDHAGPEPEEVYLWNPMRRKIKRVQHPNH